MVIGSCVYDDCDEPLLLTLPDADLPVFAKHVCDGCGREMWTKFSRVDPESWTLEGFSKQFIIHEDTKQIEQAPGD